jgi:hypothetical protein
MKYLLVAFLLAGCGLSPHGTVLVQVEIPESVQRTITGSESQYSCYFVHVTGVGIESNYTLEDLGQVNSACFFNNLGTVSAFVDADNMANGGLELALPGGSSLLHFELLRVASTTGSCPSSPADLFKDPDFYDAFSYGGADVALLTQDTLVEIVQNNESNPTELIAECLAAEPITLPPLL